MIPFILISLAVAFLLVGLIFRRSDDGSVDSWIGSIMCAIAFLASIVLATAAFIALIASHIQWK